ncbi:MAG TPA: DUF3299 domain-containing protein [Methylibium sp.]|uniref:DUF3299 domain-containing protein n=1 Tax=Methylibium sp. TaxID=2067992 RepID=UPI002DBABCF8|nr:DUF3299 domain-containing protein [Methylibium sp.]HEU4460441.1 DUF3299 domain-containing protein [Methylibium sp.]
MKTIDRRLFLAATLACAAATQAQAQAPKDTPWDQLIPKGWDPMAGFKRPPTAGLLSDSDPRVLEMMRELREVWDRAPTRPELDGTPVQLSGYVVPLEQSRGELREFLLVPYFGACIHSPPPPANQIVHVLPAKAAKGLRSMDVVTVRGAIRTQRGDTAMGATGYRIDAANVEPYVAPEPAR